jgi:hypothetical protein
VALTPEGGRVLGCLVEKQLTTPQQYPLTLNALTLACSQTSNREPVMSLEEVDVESALQELKQLHLVRFVLPSHGKSVTRYRHVLDEARGLDTARVSLVAVLLLRGPQTPGELRTRTARMVAFDSSEALQSELRTLAGQVEPLVHLLPRQPGQKEDRWGQLLAAERGPGPPGPAPVPTARDEGTGRASDGPTERSGGPEADGGIPAQLAALAADITTLREELGELRASLTALRRSLGE